MKTNLKKHLMNSVGIAIVAMLLGSNIGYAIDNYGILVNNLSFAAESDDDYYEGGTGDPFAGWKDTPGETIYVAVGTNEKGETDVNSCDIIKYARNYVEQWEKETIEASFIYGKDTEISTSFPEFGSISVSGLGAGLKMKHGKTYAVSVAFEKPACVAADNNCCEKAHMNLPRRFYDVGLK